MTQKLLIPLLFFLVGVTILSTSCSTVDPKWTQRFGGGGMPEFQYGLFVDLWASRTECRAGERVEFKVQIRGYNLKEPVSLYRPDKWIVVNEFRIEEEEGEGGPRSYIRMGPGPIWLLPAKGKSIDQKSEDPWMGQRPAWLVSLPVSEEDFVTLQPTGTYTLGGTRSTRRIFITFKEAGNYDVQAFYRMIWPKPETDDMPPLNKWNGQAASSSIRIKVIPQR
jgi:hypothetical protein